MLQNIRKLSCLTAFVFFGIGVAFAKSNPVKITIAYDKDQTFPFYLGNQTVPKTNPGVSVEISRMLENSLNVRVKFERHPWKRCQKYLETNKVDGIFNASFKTKRLKIGHYPSKVVRSVGKQKVIDKDKKIVVDTSRKLVQVTHAFFTLKGSPIKWDGKRITPKNTEVGVVHAYSINDDLKKLGIKTNTSPKPDSNVLKLLKGRVEIIAEERSKLKDLLKSYPNLKNHPNKSLVRELKIPFKVKPSYLMLSKKFVSKHPELAESIWDTIKKINNSKRIKAIYKKYYE